MKNNKIEFFSVVKADLKFYVLVFLILLISDDTYLFGTSTIAGLFSLKFIFIALFPFFLLLRKSAKVHKSDTTSKFYIAIIIIGLLILSSLFNSANLISGSLVVCFLVVSGCLFTSRFSLSRFSTTFSNIILLITLYSVIIYLLYQFIRIPSKQVENIGSSILTSCYGCIFLTPNGIIYRNAAIFREAGMLAIFISLAFLFDVLINNKINFFRIIIYTAGILTSYSTTGFIVFGLIFIVLLQKENRKGVRFIYFIAVLISIFLMVREENLIASVFGKLDQGLDNASTLSRVASTIVPLYIINDHPLFGCGLDNYVTHFYSYGASELHVFFADGSPSANTIMSSMAIWGIWMGIFFIIALWKFSKLITPKNSMRILVFFIFILLFSSQIRYLSMVTYILLFYGFSGKVILSRHLYFQNNFKTKSLLVSNELK